MAEGGAGRGWLGRTTQRGRSVEEAPHTPQPEVVATPNCAHVDAAHAPDDRHLLLTGWAENVESCTVFLHDASDPSRGRPLDIVAVPRDDVSQHLTALGRPVTTNRHGFCATVPRPDSLTVRLRLTRGDDSLWSPEFALEPQRVSLREALGFALRAAERSGSSVPQALERLARPIAPADPPPPAVADVRRFGPALTASGAPRVSVVVPFYGDGFYLLDHLMAQRRAPADAEWIFVCDDPALAQPLTDTLARHQSAIRQPTTLVRLHANGGFAHANNIGGAHARGEFLLLMNSDIYCRDFAFVDHAVARMQRDARVGCVGFSLQFEDGTVQHEGMRFIKAPWFHDLWLSDHPGKGLPQNWSAPSDVDVEAVTAALMLVRRGRLPGGRIFDPVYLYGDFEDGDLCMRLRAQGDSIVLVRTDGLYHLERQSVRRLASDDGRRAITMLNCLTFNARWRTVLSERASARPAL